MIARAGALVVALAVLGSVPALADGFFTRDLGDGGSPEQCLNRAEQTLNAYVRESGSGRAVVLRGSWSVDGYYLEPGNVNVQIACPYRDSYVSIVLAVGHSTGAESERAAVVDRIDALWNNPGAGSAPRK